MESGRVSIDGKPAMLGSQVEEHNRICINGKEIQRQERKVLLLLAPKPEELSVLQTCG